MRYLLVPFQLGDPNDAFAMNPRDTDAPSCLANSASLKRQKNPDPHEKAGGSKCFVATKLSPGFERSPTGCQYPSPTLAPKGPLEQWDAVKNPVSPEICAEKPMEQTNSNDNEK
jgi:hypothetical protein